MNTNIEIKATHPHWGRFIGLFAAIVLLGYLILNLPFLHQYVILPINVSLTHLAGGLIKLFGGEVTIAEDVLYLPSFAVQVVDMCNGVEAALLLSAGMLAFPATWGYKLKGIIIGVLAIYALNTLRIVNLLYLGAYDRDMFEWVHWYLWDLVLILYILIIFLLWLRFDPRRRTARR